MRRGICLLVLLAFGCNEKKEAAVDKSKVSAKTEAVPSDFVMNPFLPEEPNGKIAMQVRGEAGVPSAFASGSAQDTPPDPGTTPPAGPDEITVAEPGADPKVEHRYNFALNKAQARVATIKMTVAQGAQSSEEPPFKFNLQITPKVKAQDVFKLDVQVLKVELATVDDKDKARAAAASQMLTKAGLSALLGINSRGKLVDLAFNVKDERAQQAAQQIVQFLPQVLETLVPALPTAPIGVGAKWVQKSKQSDNGVAVEAISTFTLKTWGPDGGTIVADVVRKAPKSQVKDPRLPPGTTIAVDGTGHYEWTLKENQVATKVVGESSTTINIAAQGKSQVQSVKTKHTID